MDTRKPLLVIAPASRLALIEAGESQGEKKDVKAILASLPHAPQPYEFSSHYLVFVAAYLRDEGMITEADIGAKLSRQWGHLVMVLPREGVDTKKLEREPTDLSAITAEFYGDDEKTSGSATEALAKAIDTLRANLIATPSGDALVMLN